MITGFVVALPEEISTLTAKKIAKGCCAFISEDRIVAFSGTGSENARLAAEQLIAQGAQQLISWGCAAALDPALKPGDLVLAKLLIDNNLAIYETAEDWLKFSHQTLLPFITIHMGNLADSKILVTSTFDKQQLQLTTGALAVDMESMAAAKVAKQHELPFLVIRAIADPANMSLPNAVSYALNEQGDIELRKLLRFLVTHPTDLPGLIRLGLQFQAAKNTLKKIAKHLDVITYFKHPNPLQC